MAALAHAFAPEPEDDGSPSRLPLLAHLEELRARLVRSCIAIAAGTIVAFFFIDRLVAFVFAPMRAALARGGHGTTLIYTTPGEAFGLYVNIALIAGAAIASPYVLFQVWRFIAPALYANEKRFAIPFVLMSSAGVAAGWLFSHYIVFPYMIAFFDTFSSPELEFRPRVADAFDLYVKMLAGMVVVFQMPTVVFFLAKMRLVTARFLARNIKYAVLIIFIAAAVLTPSSDPWNQTVFAAPMVALYILSIGIAWLAAPRRTVEPARRS
jgi:sec-independent protein translocase protein TatC